MTKKLFIIGNGYDLQCELQSSISYFFNEKCKEFAYKIMNNDNSDYKFGSYKYNVENLEENLFTLLIYYLCENEGKFDSHLRKLLSTGNIDSWYNVEQVLKRFLLNDDIAEHKKIYDIFCDIYHYYISGNQKRFNFGAYKIFDTYFKGVCDYLSTQEGAYFPSFNNFMINELKRFECCFENHLIDHLQDNSLYAFLKPQMNKLLELNLLDRVINFNYTSVFSKEEDAKNEVNVHGCVGDEIIMGIDDRDIDNINLNYPISFTKTFRKLSMNNVKLKNILEEQIDEIVFYGHSLSMQDYSYFQSIFDKCNIYSANIKLTFMYSDNYSNNDLTKETIRATYSKSIFSLIHEYGKTMDNKDHGYNLLHKMLLEDRIHIKLVNLENKERWIYMYPRASIIRRYKMSNAKKSYK